MLLASTTMSLVEAPPALSLCTTWWWLIPVTLVPLISMMMSWTLRPAAAAGEFAITSPLMNSRLWLEYLFCTYLLETQDLIIDEGKSISLVWHPDHSAGSGGHGGGGEAVHLDLENSYFRKLKAVVTSLSVVRSQFFSKCRWDKDSQIHLTLKWVTLITRKHDWYIQ